MQRNQTRESVLHMCVLVTATATLSLSMFIFNTYFVSETHVHSCLFLAFLLIVCHTLAISVSIIFLAFCTFCFGNKAMPYQCLRMKKASKSKRGFLTLMSEIFDGSRPLMQDVAGNNENATRLLYYSDTDSDDSLVEHCSRVTRENSTLDTNNSSEGVSENTTLDTKNSNEGVSSSCEKSQDDDSIAMPVSEASLYPEIPEERYTQSTVYFNLFAPALLLYMSILTAFGYSPLEYLSFGVGIYLLSLQELCRDIQKSRLIGFRHSSGHITTAALLFNPLVIVTVLIVLLNFSVVVVLAVDIMYTANLSQMTFCKIIMDLMLPCFSAIQPMNTKPPNCVSQSYFNSNYAAVFIALIVPVLVATCDNSYTPSLAPYYHVRHIIPLLALSTLVFSYCCWYLMSVRKLGTLCAPLLATVCCMYRHYNIHAGTAGIVICWVATILDIVRETACVPVILEHPETSSRSEKFEV
jgi:hypothetical protein